MASCCEEIRMVYVQLELIPELIGCMTVADCADSVVNTLAVMSTNDEGGVTFQGSEDSILILLDYYAYAVPEIQCKLLRTIIHHIALEAKITLCSRVMEAGLFVMLSSMISIRTPLCQFEACRAFITLLERHTMYHNQNKCPPTLLPTLLRNLSSIHLVEATAALMDF